MNLIELGVTSASALVLGSLVVAGTTGIRSGAALRVEGDRAIGCEREGVRSCGSLVSL